MNIKIALAGNPNSGKTTLFNALTGSNQFVGNWPGVTVEKKEGKIKGYEDAMLIDLPGIYSLSPYTMEEVVARDYLLDERPDAILNIVDGTNLERNLYLTTQLTELGIPVVVAINMMDVVNKRGDKININKLSSSLGCKVVEISALKGTGLKEASKAAIDAANSNENFAAAHRFCNNVEQHINDISALIKNKVSNDTLRWHAVKLFERDENVIEKLKLDKTSSDIIQKIIKTAEEVMNDDSESIITGERYEYISKIINDCCKKANVGKLTTSDKIDKIVTNRFLALPIFAVVMFIVYFISVTTVGTWATDWANDGVFGDGWHLLGIGASDYEKAAEEYEPYGLSIAAFEEAMEAQGINEDEAENLTATAYVYDDEGNIEEEFSVTYADYEQASAINEPDPADYGVWVPGIPVLVSGWLESINCAEWLSGLILDGIVGGVGAVLGFVPQMFVLFLFLAFLESCGYMARIAFVMDRIFRRFGLSGKSFIPMLIGLGCSVPAIMASRTIENERDRRMTIMTTSFIPCGAKLPIIALIAGALFGGAWWVAPSAYFIGILAIVLSGIILKKTSVFSGKPAPFVMEMPAYHWPTISNLFYSMWERGWSFIKKAGTVIMLATILIWFLSTFGFADGSFGMVDMESSLLAALGNSLAWIFTPLGFGNWQAAVAAITGLIAKENVVGTFGVLYGGFEEVAENGWQIWVNMQATFTPLAAYSFLIFNLLCAPCFAAMGAIKREMNNAKWTLFAIGYQCLFAYSVSLVIYQLGMLFTGDGNIIGSAVAIALVIFGCYMLFRKETPTKKLLRKAAQAKA